MSQPYIGDIEVFGFNFAPNGWLQCNGQVIAISEYETLYALIGTTYGGNGTTTFGLPDFRGRAAVHYGTGPGLSGYALGQMAGTEEVTLLTTQMPSHTHTAMATATAGSTNIPTNNAWAKEGGGNAIYATASPNLSMNGADTGPSGGSQPHDNLSPYLTLNYCICWAGIYPQQS